MTDGVPMLAVHATGSEQSSASPYFDSRALGMARIVGLRASLKTEARAAHSGA